jgi:hypothetical protein
MKRLDFSYNWNNKLYCKAFTTLRLSNRFDIADLIEVYSNGYKIGDAIIVDKKSFLLEDINNFISFLDTGYSVEECKKILKRMYKDADWLKQKIYFYLIKYLKEGK